MSKEHFIIPIFVPHLGCPHDCIFCNQKKITGLFTNIGPDQVKTTIEEHLSTFPPGDIRVEVAFYGGSFTGIQREVQEGLLSIPYQYKKRGLIEGIRLSTRPDYIDEEILSLLKNYEVDTIELGVQSLDQEVLDSSHRGHRIEDVYRAVSLIKEAGFNLGLQMMVGLSGDTREKSIFTAKEFVKMDPYCVRIYPTLVIKDTYLSLLFEEEKYQPLPLDQAVDIVTDLLLLFNYYNIDVIRIGLQPTENIQLGADVLAGPFHPSFRQLVEGNIYKLIIDEQLDRYSKDLLRDKLLEIRINSRNISNLVNQKSQNKKHWISKYNLRNIKIKGDNLPLDKIEIGLGDLILGISKKELEEDLLIKRNILEVKRC